MLGTWNTKLGAERTSLDLSYNKRCAAWFWIIISNVVVICFDEIDHVRNLPFATDDFFATIRSCYNERAQNPNLKRLTFCLVGTARPTDLMDDPQSTPFDIGQAIDLTGFTF
ncbi:MAG TPA: hypothetical protein ENG03_10390 [Thioploca sp.]|nr:MAG: hypothetical protein B6247_25395 [Beggiatoa sp. 4572_84]RKZ60880.1 MAG: hypothetical protein DRR08_10165 [Gammaproteobacteria bacterium]HDN27482.1 hypothetical protein [Thioploca sp.]